MNPDRAGQEQIERYPKRWAKTPDVAIALNRLLSGEIKPKRT
jgi:hypothetical protein